MPCSDGIEGESPRPRIDHEEAEGHEDEVADDTDGADGWFEDGTECG